MKQALIWGVVVVVLAGAGYYGYRFYSSNNAMNPGQGQNATSTPDQVQGQEVKVGTGKQATAGSVVTVEYVGKLPDGTVFDSTAAHNNEPLVFTLGMEGIIPGFQIGVNGMKEGGERLIAIPPALGYGAQQVGSIPPNSTLIFELKLLKVVPPAATSTTP